MKIIDVFLYTSNVQIPLYGHATLIIGISDGAIQYHTGSTWRISVLCS